MPNENGSVMDAINLALETGDVGSNGAEDQLETPASTEGNEADGSNSSEESGDEGAAKPTAKAGDEGEQGEGDAESGKHVDEDGKALERDPATGKFVPRKAAESDGKPAADGKGAKPGEKPAVEAKKPDPVNDPIPKDAAPGTQERIRTLIKQTKEITAERDHVRGDFDALISGVQATGTTPEQYGEVLSFMALFNSNDAAQQEKALEILDSVADRLATLIGKDRSVSDPLKDHTDLREAVAKGQVTTQYAKEIARTRNSTAFRHEITTQHNQTQEQQRTAQTELATARSDLNTLESTLKATDPQYEAKRQVLVPILAPIFKTLPPAQWKAKFEEAYKSVPVTAQSGANKPAVPARQPMRAGRSGGANASGAGASSGGQQKGSALDAINNALANMPR